MQTVGQADALLREAQASHTCSATLACVNGPELRMTPGKWRSGRHLTVRAEKLNPHRLREP